MRSPREELARVVSDLQRILMRLEAEEMGGAIFTREDVDRIVSERLAREHKKARRLAERTDELEEEVEKLRESREAGF